MVKSRALEPTERLEGMVGWEGPCKYCGDKGFVAMLRDSTPPYTVRPENCHCLLCGQHYFMVIENLEAFVARQRQEKESK